jgi:hypothetical protein
VDANAQERGLTVSLLHGWSWLSGLLAKTSAQPARLAAHQVMHEDLDFAAACCRLCIAASYRRKSASSLRTRKNILETTQETKSGLKK